MRDKMIIRCVSILGGIALLIAAGVAGFNGEIHAIAYALLGFGVGTGFGSYVTAKRAEKAQG